MRWRNWTTIVLLCGTLPAAGDVVDSVCKMTWPSGQCTAVCVSADGLVVTVKHCAAEAESATFAFPGRSPLTGVRVHVGSREDDCAVFRVDGEDLPAVRVATTSPQPGDAVWSCGYPAGQFTRAEGRIVSGATFGDGQGLNVVSFGTGRGWSGGPLFNADGELLGVLSSTDAVPVHDLTGRVVDLRIPTNGRSYFVRWDHTVAAIAAAAEEKAPAKADLIVFGADGCGPCRRFEADLDHFRARWNVRIVHVFDDEDRQGWYEQIGGEWQASNLATQFAAKHGKIKEIPTFWIPAKGQFTTGYTGQGGLIGWLERIFAAGVVSITGESPFAVPLDRGSPADPQVDWSHIKVIVAVPELLDATLGLFASVAERRAVGPLRRAVAERTGGKAALDVVFERIEPERFRAYLDAAGLGESVSVTVLVREHNQTGVIRDLILARIAAAIEGRLADAPIEVLFERTHPADVAAIEAALAIAPSVDVDAFERTPGAGAEPIGLVDEVKGAILGEVKQQLVDAVTEKLGEKLPAPVKEIAEGWFSPPVRDGIDTGILGSLLALIASRVWPRKITLPEPKS